MNQLTIHSNPLPFSHSRKSLQVPQGSTLDEIVNHSIKPEFQNWAEIGIIVMVNGETIPRQHWKSIRPKMGTIVNVNVVPGKGGGKNPLATLLSIAVLIAAPYISGAILGNGIIASTALGAKAISVGLTAAIGVAGRLAVAALAPPPKPSNSGFSNVSNPAESPTQFIEGATNQLLPYGPIPVNLGINRMFPPQAARRYFESENNDQYVRQLFTYGYGKQVISDLKFGETSIDEYTGIDMEHRLDGDLEQGTTIYSNDVYQEDLSVLLQEVDGYTTRTTQIETNEAIVDITFPQGLTLFNSEGRRTSYRVELELQYAESGVSPQDWSPAQDSYKTVDATSVSFDVVTINSINNGNAPSGEISETRRDIVVIDKYTTEIYVVKGQSGYTTAQPVPSNAIKIADVDVTRTRQTNGVLVDSISMIDARNTALFGDVFENSTDFVPTENGNNVDIAAGTLKVNDLSILGNQREALRISKRIIFPTAGQYDLRIRRITEDGSSDRLVSDVYLTAIKSIKYTPPVNLAGLSGSALRALGTDQLNGPIDQFNVTAKSVLPDYDSDLDSWPERITSNPASLYRYVLQGLPNGKRLNDNQIILEDLEAWHTYCSQRGYTYNRVIDYETTVDEVLRDIAAAGAATPNTVDGLRTIAIDQAKDATQIITARNVQGFSGELIYPDLPHAFRVQFRNKDKGYVQDEIIVYRDGYDENNATEFEGLELFSSTSVEMAIKTTRRHLAAAELRPEVFTWEMDFEHLTSVRGDRVKVVNDIPLIGVGEARIKTVIDDGGSPALVTGLTIDDVIAIPTSTMVYYTRIRLSDGTQLYKQLTTTQGETTSLTFTTPFDITDTPSPGDLLYVVEAGNEKDLLITKIEPRDDLRAFITAIDYAPGVLEAETGAIPAHNSNITIPLEFIRPNAPILLDEQSNEQVMLLNSDGSYTSRAVFTLQNTNAGDTSVIVKARVAGTSKFIAIDILEKTPEKVAITGLEDGLTYDIYIYYKVVGRNQISQPLQLNNYKFVGASTLPDDVENFTINVVGQTALLKWDSNDDIDLSHYILKYSAVYSGATWETAQTLESFIQDNRVSVPFLGGTYLIKAVDILGNESDGAANIITYDPGTIENAVATVTEHSSFTGTKTNTTVVGGGLVLSDIDTPTGEYEFANSVDLTGVFPAFISATVVANGVYLNDIFDVTDIFAESDIFGGAGNNVFDMDDIFEQEDIFGIGSDAWRVELYYRTTQDNGVSPIVWSDWLAFEAKTVEFEEIEFKVILTSLDEAVSPQITQLEVRVDMPDRIERGEDLTVPVAGTSITFSPEFKETPAVAITIQDGETDDKIEYTGKTSGGFTFKVYNDTAGDYVERSYDYIASGYGRKNTA